MIGKDQPPEIGKKTQFKKGKANKKPRQGTGRPKGTRSLSTIIRDLGENPIKWKDLPVKNHADLTKQFGNEKSVFEAIVLKAVSEALKGNIKAMEWLRKAGYGDKLEIDTGKGTGLFNAQDININIINPDSHSKPASRPKASPRPKSA